MVALTCVVSWTLKAEDWPAYRGTNADGIVTESGLLTDWPAAGPKLLWSVPLHDEGKSSHGGPSIAGGKVVLPFRSGNTDIIVCLSVVDGKELWRYAYDVPFRAEAFGIGIRTNPTISGNRVYTLACFGQLHCIDFETGKPVWEKDFIKDFHGRIPGFGESASPIVMNGKLICEPGGKENSVVALDPETGATLWHSGNAEASYSTPQKITLDGVDQVLAFMDTGLFAYDLTDGRELWRFDYQEERRKNIPQPVVVGNTIYLTNNTLGFAAIKVTKPVEDSGKWNVERVWSMRKEKLHYSSPVLGDGCIYYQNSKRELHCMDLATGEVTWSAPNMGQQFATLLRLDPHTLLAALDDGQVALLDVSAKAFHEKARFTAVDKTFVQPSVADHKLFIRDHEHLACYDLKAEEIPAPTPVAAVPAVKPPPETGFLATWKYKRNDFYVTALSALALALIGVWALSRREIVEAAVVCEAALAGCILAMLAGGLPAAHKAFIHSSQFGVLMPLLLACIGALIAGFGRLSPLTANTSRRAWIAGGCFAALIFILSRIPVSTIDVSSIIFSTEYAGTRSEVSNLKYTVAATLPLILLALSAPGLRAPKPVRFILAIWFAVMLGLCTQATGGVFALACLLLPALIAEKLAANIRARVLLATLGALFSTVAGWLLAQNHTYTFAFPAAAVMVVLLAFAHGFRQWVRRDLSPLSVTAPVHPNA